jgi:hypothetical protein
MIITTAERALIAANEQTQSMRLDEIVPPMTQEWWQRDVWLQRARPERGYQTRWLNAAQEWATREARDRGAHDAALDWEGVADRLIRTAGDPRMGSRAERRTVISPRAGLWVHGPHIQWNGAPSPNSVSAQLTEWTAALAEALDMDDPLVPLLPFVPLGYRPLYRTLSEPLRRIGGPKGRPTRAWKREQ